MEELKAFIKSNPDPRELKRAIAVKMTLEGHPHQEIMPALQVSSGFISKWKKAYLAEGVPGLTLKYKGSQGYLNKQERATVIQWLQEKDYWHLRELECYLIQEYDVVFAARSSYYELFQAAGISWKKTQKKNPKKDEQLVEKKKKKLSKF